MVKKSDNKKNMSDPLREVYECMKKKAKETKKASDSWKKTITTIESENNYESLRRVHESLKAMEAQKEKEAQIVKEAHMKQCAIDRELRIQLHEKYHEAKMEKKEKIMNHLLSIGFVFQPTEGKLLDYYLRNKIMGNLMDFCPIKEVDIYRSHPQVLIGKFGICYFFTRRCPNEIQHNQQHWIFGKKEDVFNQDGKVGVKQVVEYCEGGRKSEYKIIEYQLDPAPDDMKTGLWCVCKLYNDGSCADVHSGP